MRVDWLNPEELQDALDVIRKSVEYERHLRLQLYEETRDDAVSHDYRPPFLNDHYEDYLAADHAKRLWDQIEKTILSPFDSGKTAYGTIACGGNKL